MALTPTTEDYLQAIDSLRSEGEDVIAARIAERLHVTPASVSQTIDRMVRQDLVAVGADHQIAFTEAGRVAAESIIRRHRLTERFLVDVLGLDWMQAHEEAHRLEHAVSEVVEQRMSAVLGGAATCPHGAPIPGNFPEGADAAWRKLDSFDKGEEVTIARISEAIEDQPELLQYCADKGLRPGAVAMVSETGPDGLVLLEMDSAAIAVSAAMAAHVSCLPGRQVVLGA